jgi:hypothetical protein
MVGVYFSRIEAIGPLFRANAPQNTELTSDHLCKASAAAAHVPMPAAENGNRERQRVLILGASGEGPAATQQTSPPPPLPPTPVDHLCAGRDYHTFNTKYRTNSHVCVVGFTHAQVCLPCCTTPQQRTPPPSHERQGVLCVTHTNTLLPPPRLPHTQTPSSLTSHPTHQTPDAHRPASCHCIHPVCVSRYTHCVK